MSITGVGSASKEQVAAMLTNILKFSGSSMKLDATEGLAAALCHFYQSGRLSDGNKIKSWKQFVRNNPERIK
jgi:crossover junction endodeoxyribonuclease RuvC